MAAVFYANHIFFQNKIKEFLQMHCKQIIHGLQKTTRLNNDVMSIKLGAGLMLELLNNNNQCIT